MRLDIRGLNLDLTDAILGHVRDRLRAALDPFAGRVGGVMVRVNDVNGPRGGAADKRCHLEVNLDGLGTVVVEQSDADLYAAVDRAAARLRQTIRRQMARNRSLPAGRRVSASGLPT